MTGYGGGIARKKWLIEHEAKISVQRGVALRCGRGFQINQEGHGSLPIAETHASARLQAGADRWT